MGDIFPLALFSLIETVFTVNLPPYLPQVVRMRQQHPGIPVSAHSLSCQDFLSHVRPATRVARGPWLLAWVFLRSWQVLEARHLVSHFLHAACPEAFPLPPPPEAGWAGIRTHRFPNSHSFLPTPPSAQGRLAPRSSIANAHPSPALLLPGSHSRPVL